MYVEPSGDLRVVLRGPGEVLLFGEPPYRQRLVTFLSLRRDLAEKAPGAEQFDLRFRGRIFAKLARGRRPRPSEPGVRPLPPGGGESRPIRPGGPAGVPPTTPAVEATTGRPARPADRVAASVPEPWPSGQDKPALRPGR